MSRAVGTEGREGTPALLPAVNKVKVSVAVWSRPCDVYMHSDTQHGASPSPRMTILLNVSSETNPAMSLVALQRL